MEITDKGVLEGSFMDFTVPTEFAKHALFFIPQYGHFRCDGLNDICRESMSDWLLLAYRLLKAKQMLLSDERSIEQIAEVCGFNSASRFARAFRKSSGISPSARSC